MTEQNIMTFTASWYRATTSILWCGCFLEMSYSVYKHTSPSGKVYIGITSKPVNQRWRNGKGYKTQRLIARAIEKYGWENFEHEVLYRNISQDEARKIEVELIQYYKSNDPKYGYNICQGGDTGPLGLKMSESTKEKMRIAFTGRKMSEEARKNMSIAQKKAQAKYKGKKKPKEVCDKMGIETICLETKKIYTTATNAARDVGIGTSSITSACTGLYDTAAGLHWMYVKDMKGTPEEELIRIKNSVMHRWDKVKPQNSKHAVICVETNERYESVAEAARSIGADGPRIIHSIKKGCCACGLHFVYEEENAERLKTAYIRKTEKGDGKP